MWKTYLLPESLDEALRLLREARGRARVIAGGTDLLLDLQQGRHPPVHQLIDVTRIPELLRLEADGRWIYLGAAVTHRRIVDSPLLQDEAACLVQACGVIGGPQVRNVATIGGNVAHALPAGDGTIALLALGAEAELAGAEGRRWHALGQLFKGPGQPAFDPGGEILVQFRFPRRGPGERSAFDRIMRPQGVAIAILNMALWLRLQEGQAIEDVRLAVGPAGPVPFRAHETENFLRGRVLKAETIAAATQVLAGEARLRTSRHRATAAYRRHLLGVLLQRLLDEELSQSGALMEGQGVE
jgi:carbon-monoxide dehydrogenase medium subunit